MENQTLGTKIAALRKERGMTQLELAQQMGVTDKAVSKWERDLACPDVHSLPKLAGILGVRVDTLMLSEQEPADRTETPGRGESIRAFKLLIFRAVALAMGIALVVLSMLKQLDVYSGLGLAGVGVTALSLHAFFAEGGKQ